MFWLVNGITVARVVLGCAIVDLAATEAWTMATVLLVVGQVSDVIDGALARRFNVTSPFGSQLDMLADCFLIFGPILGLVLAGIWPAWVMIVIAAAALGVQLGYVVPRQGRRPFVPVVLYGSIGLYIVITAIFFEHASLRWEAVILYGLLFQVLYVGSGGGPD